MTARPKTSKSLPSNEALRAEAGKLYAKEAGSGPFLPGGAKKLLAKKYGVEAGRFASSVDPVYFDRNGRAAPIALPKTRSERTLATAVRKRRDAGGTLGRWESVASALSETLGRPVSETAVRALYSKGGGSLDSSYVGRGTRKAAPATRSDEAAEVVATS